MITELFVENYPVDISKEIDALMTYCIDDIKDFSSRNTTFSKTIVIPGTAKNNKAFGNIFEMGAAALTFDDSPNIGANYNIAKAAKCIMFQGNLQVFKGIIRILKIVIDRNHIEYECALFGELAGFISALGVKRLEDLDFSAYNHQYSIANIENSWNATPGTGYYYPLIDYGKASNDKHDYQYQTFRAALFVHEYMDKIITGSNYTYDCAFFNTNFFKRLIVPNNRNALEKNEVLSIQGDIDCSGSPFSNLIVDNYIPIDYTTLLGFTTPDNIYFTNTALLATNYNCEISGTLLVINPIIWNDPTFEFTFDVNGQINKVIYSATINTPPHGLFSFNFNVSFFTSLATNDVISLRLRTRGIFIFQIIDSSISIYSSQIVPLPAVLGDNIKINENLPKNILQKDFFSSIIKMFNLMVVDDKNIPNHLNIIPYNNFYDNNPDNAIDWTYKLDRSKPMQITPMSEANARYYNIKFKSDTDYYNDKYKKKYNTGYGDVIFDNALDFAKDNITKEVIFSASPLVGYPSEDKIVCPILKWDGTQPQNEDKIGSNLRIMQIKKIDGVSSWDIVQSIGGTVLGTNTVYPYAGHFDDPDIPSNDVNFDVPKELYYELTQGVLTNNLFNTFWLPYMYEIIDKDSKLLTATFRLNEQDINQLDFSKLIYIDGILYRLSKIIDYNASQRDVCKAELLKVMQLTYTESVAAECIATEENDCLLTEDDNILTIE